MSVIETMKYRVPNGKSRIKSMISKQNQLLASY